MTNTTSVPHRGDRVDGVVFAARKKAMSRAALQRALAPVLLNCIKSTCLWDDRSAIGDHRYVIFSIVVAPRVNVYVQFWAEPAEPVLWEVSSGRSNPPADKWLAGNRSQRIEALGFEIGGDAENYHREVEVRTATDAKRIADAVVDIFYSGFDYRGLRPIKVEMAYDSRAEARFAYDSFAPDDLVKILGGCGFRVAVVDDDEDGPALRAVRRGVVTTVTCVARVPDQHLFQGAVLTSEVEVPPEDAAAALKVVKQATGVSPASMKLGTTLLFDGGVTVGWVAQRIQEWDHMTWSSRNDARRRRKPRALSQSARVP